MTSRDRVNSELVVCGVEPPVSSRCTIPPSAARPPATVKATSLNPYGRRPSTSTRRSFSLTPSQTLPVGEWVVQCTTTSVRPRKARAIQYRLAVFWMPTREAGREPASTARPSSPPVKPPGSRATTIEPAWANASVTIEKPMPVTRRLTEPSSTASTTPKTSPSTADRPNGRPACCIMVLVA